MSPGEPMKWMKIAVRWILIALLCVAGWAFVLAWLVWRLVEWAFPDENETSV